MSAPREWTITQYVRGLATNVVVDPIRNGTMRLRGHSPTVVGIAIFVGLIYAVLLVAIAAARPLRAASDFVADTSRGDVSVIPAFLVPMLLFLLGLSFALVLAGSQRSHPALRVTMLVAVLAIVGSIVMVVPNREVAGLVWWVAVACAVLVAVYSLLMWSGRTPPVIDFLVLFILLEAAIVASYRATVVGQASSDLRFDIVTTALLLTYLTLLASPLAFSGGLSAVGVGAATVAWSADFARRRARPMTVLVLLVLAALWQGWVTFGNVSNGLTTDAGDSLRSIAGALLLVALGWGAWILIAGRRPADPDRNPEDDAVEMVADAGRFGLPLGYGLQSIVILTALLGMVVVGLAVLAPDVTASTISSIIELLSSADVATITRWAVVAGLVVATIVLMSRARWIPAAIATVNAIIIASLIAMSGDAWLSDWAWTPESLGDLGVLAATVLAVWWLIRGRWSADRAGLLLLLLLMSALVRQAAILEVPLGLLLSASATGVLIFGLSWGFLTGGSTVHEDSPHAHRDRRLFLFLGQSLYGIAIVAWAVIGKEIDALGTLSEVTALAVLTLGTSLILLTVYQQFSKGLNGLGVDDPRSSSPEGMGVDVLPDAGQN